MREGGFNTEIIFERCISIFRPKIKHTAVSTKVVDSSIESNLTVTAETYFENSTEKDDAFMNYGSAVPPLLRQK